MRITRGKLQDLINEEISRALLKQENSRLTEAHHMGDSLQEADVTELLSFADAYASLGQAVQEQLKDLVDDPEEASCNPNAVKMIQDLLMGYNEELDTALGAWEEANELGPPEDVDESADPLHVEDKGLSDAELSKYRCKKCRQGTADVRMDGEPGYECNICGQSMPEIGDIS